MARSIENDVLEMRVLARRGIESGQIIYPLFAVIANDSKADHTRLSEIYVDSKRRVMTGPIRFINSDCKPNAEVRGIVHSSVPSNQFAVRSSDGEQ